MATFKIKLEDKAAFLNRMEKAGVGLDTDQAVDNKLEGYFEVVVDEPKQLEAVKTILKQSPKINTINEMETNKKKLTKDELKEMVRQELLGVLAEKKKAKKEDEKEKLDENEQLNEVDPAVMDAIQAIGGFGALVGTAFGIVKAGTMAAKKELKAKFAAAGKEVPDEKTLDALAKQSFKAAMDRSTGAGLGANTPDVKI